MNIPYSIIIWEVHVTHKTNFLHILTLSHVYWASKTFPIGNVLLLGLENICFSAFDFNDYSDGLLLETPDFNINRICIVVFTCNVYIRFLPFVGVSTCSVWFMLSISRTQLFKKVIDSIQGPMLFLISLVQFNYLFSKTFKMSLQSMTTCKFISLNIFQVFRKVNKTCSITCFT